MLYYSKKFKYSPFESGLYDLRLYIEDVNNDKDLAVYNGDSLYKYVPSTESESPIDTTLLAFRVKQSKLKQFKENYRDIKKFKRPVANNNPKRLNASIPA